MNSPGPRSRQAAGPDSFHCAIAAARWTGVDPTRRQIELLDVYWRWLAEEAIPAGGLGPNETDRLWERHIADSLLFGNDLGERPTCIDIGSGVGLPGIPLAIVHPQTQFDLVDKSGRRCDLLRRALGVLGVANCRVVHSELVHVTGQYPFAVSRAAIPAHWLLIHVKHRLEPGGIANLSVARAGSSQAIEFDVPSGIRLTTVTVPDKILDTKVQLLRIEAIRNGS